jgi:hypothetical protein
LKFINIRCPGGVRYPQMQVCYFYNLCVHRFDLIPNMLLFAWTDQCNSTGCLCVHVSKRFQTFTRITMYRFGSSFLTL